MAQFWFVLSDFVLEASVVYGVVLLLMTTPLDSTILAVIGFIVIGLAALVGLLRFLLPEPPCVLIKIHRSLCWLGITTGLSLIAAQMFQQQQLNEISSIFIAFSILVLVVKILSDYRSSMVLSEFVAAMSVLSILTIGLLAPSTYGCLGSVVLVLTGLMVATRGRRLQMPSVDIFHYGLSLAILAYARALQNDASSNDGADDDE